MRDQFARVAARIAEWMGSAWAFTIAALVVLIWAVSGPVFNFTNTWQLVINTGTTIVTFLMVFIIQNTQNRQARATQLKLDELIRAVREASDRLIDIEESSDEELEQLQENYRRQAQQDHR